MHQQHNENQVRAVPQLRKSQRETDRCSTLQGLSAHADTHAYASWYRQHVQTVYRFVVQPGWCVDTTDKNTFRTVHWKSSWHSSSQAITASSWKALPDVLVFSNLFFNPWNAEAKTVTDAYIHTSSILRKFFYISCNRIFWEVHY